MTWNTRLRIVDLDIPRSAGIGLVEDLHPINKVSVRREVNGGALVMRSPWARKFGWSVKASGKNVRYFPTFEGIELGDTITVQCLTYLTDRIPTGYTGVLLKRPPVPGSIRVVDVETETSIAFTLADRTVTIASRASTALVHFRPILDIVVTQIQGSSDELQANQPWGAEGEEA